MISKKVNLLILIISIIAEMFIAACPVLSQETINSLIENAKKEGNLTWYTSWSLMEAQQINNRFREKYPFIDAVFYRGRRPELVARFETESRLKRYITDALLLGGSDMYNFKKAGLLKKYVPLESKYFSADKKDPDGLWSIASYNIGSLVYNTRLVSPKELPKNLNDLLDPKWKGQIVGDTGKIYYFMPLLQYLGEEKGLAYLKKLAPQIVPRNGSSLALTLCAAAEYKLVYEAGTKTLDEAIKKGMPLSPLFLEYVRQTTAPAGISINAPHPNAAKLFMEYLLSEEGQKVIADLDMFPSRTGIEPKGPSLVKAFALINNKQVRLIPEKVDWVDDAKRYQKLFDDSFRYRSR